MSNAKPFKSPRNLRASVYLTARQISYLDTIADATGISFGEACGIAIEHLAGHYVERGEFSREGPLECDPPLLVAITAATNLGGSVGSMEVGKEVSIAA